jgi:NarL family two-component system response regulator LiaR
MTQDHKIRILLVDDNDVLRIGLTIFIETFEDLQFVGEGANGVEAVELCTQLQPDIVLMDLKMPVMDGVTATRIITERFPSVRVIALTSFDDEPLIQSAKQAGIYSYLLKNVSVDTMVTVIRDAYRADQITP